MLQKCQILTYCQVRRDKYWPLQDKGYPSEDSDENGPRKDDSDILEGDEGSGLGTRRM